MTTTSKSVQSFNRSTTRLANAATREGVNVSKAQVTKALQTLTADGKVSKADVAAARAFLEKAPLTAGAKDALKTFIRDAGSTAGGGGSVRGGGESGGLVRGGGEGGVVSRGGGESFGGGGRVRGGGTGGGGRVRGGGEAGGGGSYVRGGGESGGGGYSYGGGSFGGGE